MMTGQTVDLTATPMGCVEIGVPPSGPGAHFFPVFGGLIGVDVVDTDKVPFASLVDVSLAAWWLEAVYGAEVAAAAVELAPPLATEEDSETDTEDPASRVDTSLHHLAVELNPGPLWIPLIRFGIGTWIQRWWPSSDSEPRVRLDETLMDLEVGVLAWSLEFVLGGTSAAAALLEGHVDEVIDILENRSPDDALLGPVLRAIIESVSVIDDQYELLREHEERLELVAHSANALTDEALALLYDDLLVTDNSYISRRARADFGERDPNVRSTESFVDIEQVPARSVSWTQDAVWARVHGISGALEVDVRVRAGDVPTDLPLFARVFFNDNLLPSSVIELTRDGGSYVGTARPEGDTLPDSFMVDIFTPSLMARPDPARSERLRAAVEPILEELVGSALTVNIEAVPVQDLRPSAPWRALVAGARRRG